MTTEALGLKTVARSHPGLQRSNNEDAFLVVRPDEEDTATTSLSRVFSSTPPGVLFIVADGMGGAAAGEVASNMAVERIHTWLAERLEADGSGPGEPGADEPGVDEPGPDDAEQLLDRAIREANRAIFEHASRDDNLQGMGTTVTLAWIRGRDAYIAQVGDSRAYLARNHHLRRLTRDQTLVDRLVSEKKITPEQARGHAQANVILQALGVKRDVEPVTTVEALAPGDLLLLCSDGLTDTVDDDELAELLARKDDLRAISDALITMANDRGGPDNITVVLLECGEVDELQPEDSSLDTEISVDTLEIPPMAKRPDGG